MASPTGRKTLKAREFLFYTEDLAVGGLPTELPHPQRRVMWTILQLYHTDPTVHFEIQPQGARGQVELGLHFEADADTNERRAQHVAAHAPEILGVLGPEWELEEWTASWRRLHRVFRYERLTAELGREVAESFTRLMTTMAPFVEELEAVAPAMETRSAGTRAPSRHRGGRARARR